MEFSKKTLFALLLITSCATQALEIIVKNNSSKNMPNYKLVIYELTQNSKIDIVGEGITSGEEQSHIVIIHTGVIYYFGIFTAFENTSRSGKKSYNKFCVQLKAQRKLYSEDVVTIAVEQDGDNKGDASLDILSSAASKDGVLMPSIPALMRYTQL